MQRFNGYFFRKLFFFSFIALNLLAFSCRSPEKEKTGKYFEWVDSYQRKVALDREPLRIISLSPSITEMIFLLHGEAKLVGVSDFCDYPPQTAGVKRVGGMQNINIEALVELNPDVVLIGSIVQKEDVEKIEKVGIPVIAIKEENKITGIFNSLEILGKILNKEELATKQIDILKRNLSEIKIPPVSEEKKPSVYYVVGFGNSGDYTAPKNSHIHEIISLAGGKNIGDVLSGWNISREYLFEQDPDIIIIRKEDMDIFCKTYPYNKLSAVINKRVYPIESGWIDIVSPRNVDAVKMINDCIRNYTIKTAHP